MPHKTTAFFFFVTLSDHIQGSRWHFDSCYKLTASPQRQSTFFTVLQYVSELLEMFVAQWHAMFPVLETVWRSNPAICWISLKCVLRCWIMGEWPLIAITDLSCKNKTLLFTRYPQIILNRR